MTTKFHAYRGSREVRNKRIADEAVTMLRRVVNEEWTIGVLDAEFDAFIKRWEARGVSWLSPSSTPYDPDEWLTANEMAERADIDPATVRRWHLRGHITADKSGGGQIRYNVGEVAAYQARRHNGGYR